MKKTISDIIFDSINFIFIAIIIIAMIYPLYFVIIASLSDPYAVATGKVTFWIKGISFDAYKYTFKHKEIWTGYMNTIFYTLAGTGLNLLLTIPTAYSLSKKKLPGRSLISWYFLFTMYFGGGLIPTYLLVRDLNLLNKPYTIPLLGGISIYNTIVTRIFYQTTIPDELYEAAYIDGASDFRQFIQIALPLSAPIIAVMTLYYGVGRWNDYYTALIYISKSDYYPLQMVLRSILIQNKSTLDAIDTVSTQFVDDEYVAKVARQAYMAEAMKYSLIIIASAPLLVAYPFVQKHFVKGVMIGSLKG